MSDETTKEIIEANGAEVYRSKEHAIEIVMVQVDLPIHRPEAWIVGVRGQHIEEADYFRGTRSDVILKINAWLAPIGLKFISEQVVPSEEEVILELQVETGEQLEDILKMYCADREEKDGANVNENPNFICEVRGPLCILYFTAPTPEIARRIWEHDLF